MDERTLDRWFLREVLPHQEALLRYLRWICRSDSADAMDIMQEALVRVYSSARKKTPDDPKKFLFATGRNIFLDLVRRAKVVTIDTATDLVEVSTVHDERSLETYVSTQQEWRILSNAMVSLPGLCQEVIKLRRIYGFSQRETAEKLGISEAAVESHIRRGVRRLAEKLRSDNPIAEGHLVRIDDKRSEKKAKSVKPHE